MVYLITLCSYHNRYTHPYEKVYINGETVILLDGYTKGISTSTRNENGRAISEPVNESVIRGPREAFTETLRTNTALIRRKIKDPNLWLKSRVIGKYTKTNVSIMYINSGVIGANAFKITISMYS